MYYCVNNYKILLLINIRLIPRTDLSMPRGGFDGNRGWGTTTVFQWVWWQVFLKTVTLREPSPHWMGLEFNLINEV